MRGSPTQPKVCSQFGPYWAITRYEDIPAVDMNHRVFSSEAGGVGRDGYFHG